MRTILSSGFLQFLKRIIELFGAMILITILTLAAVQVFLRYIVGFSLFWAEEVISYLFIWMVFIGAILATKNNSHPYVDLFIKIFGDKLKPLFLAFRDLLITVYGGVLIVQGFKLFTLTNSITPALLIPYKYVYLSMPMCALFIVMYSIANLIEHLTMFSKSSQEE